MIIIVHSRIDRRAVGDDRGARAGCAVAAVGRRRPPRDGGSRHAAARSPSSRPVTSTTSTPARPTTRSRTRSRTRRSDRCSPTSRTASTPSPTSPRRCPRCSNGGRTVTVHIRPGIRFSPPVNRAVTSADVKYAIERGFATSVANGYVGAYFGDLVGAPRAATKSVPEDPRDPDAEPDDDRVPAEAPERRLLRRALVAHDGARAA